MSHSFTWRYPADAWQWACNTIQSRGDLVKTEDDQLTREVLNLMVTVLEPQSGWPIPGSGWDMAGLNKYAEQLLCKENPGFDYTYGNRLRSHEAMFVDPDDKICSMTWDQIALIIGKLKRSPNSRRCVAITWHPETDIVACHSPCLQSVDFLFRQGKLHLTAYFRSQDVARAWPANLYGLSRLLTYVGDQAGMQPGSITTISASAHIYER